MDSSFTTPFETNVNKNPFAALLFYRPELNRKKIIRPKYWGGYRLFPSWFEFWQVG